ncbi:MAG: hypothetical protein IT261_01405 [Saprospiraceae bacterium]|nr:hypothetical protein [Saprospiraceae bacterium]
MLNRKLLEALKLLSSSEQARFLLFLQSPYFNHRNQAEALYKLCEFILQHKAEEDHPALSKKNVSEIFFPNKPFIDNKKGPLDGLASDLFNLLKKFLAFQAFEHQRLPFEESMSLAQFYRRFGMEERYWQVIQAERKSMHSLRQYDAGYYERLYSLEEEASSFEALNNSFEDDANLTVAAINLDLAYTLHKLELICAISYQQKLSQKVVFDFDAPLTRAVMQLPPEVPPNPIHEIYLLVFSLIGDPNNDEAFNHFEDLLQRHKNAIPFEKLRNLKAYSRYFYNRRYVHSGSSPSRENLYQLYKEHYEQGYFYEGDAILVNALKALVLIGLKQGDYDWVKSVLDKHPPSRICGTRYPVEAHSLCLSEYFFYIKDYNKASESLKFRHFENPNFSIWAEMLMLKIYFETEDELLEYRMKSLDQKVRRTKIFQEHKNSYYRFLQKLDKIVKYGQEKKSPKRLKLIEEIKNTPGIIERDWLLEKLHAG